MADTELRPIIRILLNILIICLRLAAVIMLFIATSEQARVFYTTLLWVVCISAICPIAIRFEGGAAGQFHRGWLWLFVPIAIIFNPLLPVSQSKEVWQVIDAVAALILLAGIYFAPPLLPLLKEPWQKYLTPFFKKLWQSYSARPLLKKATVYFIVGSIILSLFFGVMWLRKSKESAYSLSKDFRHLENEESAYSLTQRFKKLEKNVNSKYIRINEIAKYTNADNTFKSEDQARKDYQEAIDLCNQIQKEVEDFVPTFPSMGYSEYRDWCTRRLNDMKQFKPNLQLTCNQIANVIKNAKLNKQKEAAR